MDNLIGVLISGGFKVKYERIKRGFVTPFLGEQLPKWGEWMIYLK